MCDSSYVPLWRCNTISLCNRHVVQNLPNVGERARARVRKEILAPAERTTLDMRRHGARRLANSASHHRHGVLSRFLKSE